MKHIKLFEEFKSHQEIDEICTKYKIKNYTINDDGSIDVDGNVNLNFKNLIELPLKFRNVTGSFTCSYNDLTSLDGSPSSVGSSFHCINNDLKSLEGAPSYVGVDFYCSFNKLTSLYGAPSYVGGKFDCSINSLISLEYSPNRINGEFHFLGNKIYTFDFFPDFINGKNVYPGNSLSYIFSLFNEDENLIDAFNDYNIIKAPKNTNDMPRIKVSNLNKFLSDNGFEEVEDTSDLEVYYDLK